VTTQTLDDIMSGRDEPAPDTTTLPTPAETALEPAPQDNPTEPDGDDQPGPSVPKAELDRQKRRYTEMVASFEQKLAESNAAWERRFEQLIATLRPQQPAAPPAPAPDLFEDPNAFIQQAIAPVAQETATMREQFSQMMAVEKHGAETVEAAYRAMATALQSDPQAQLEYRRITASAHPYGALVAWHERNQVLSEIGPDPKAYREKLRAEILAELQAAPPQPQPTRAAPPVMPSSFSQARNPGPRGAPQWSGPRPLSEIMPR
jgi:hypothetical protein